MTSSIREISCADDYDPNSMPVDKAREFISRVLSPIADVERVNIRAALASVLATSVSCRASWHCGTRHKRCEALLAIITISPATRLPETYSVFP
jgi:hypothetical protein